MAIYVTGDTHGNLSRLLSYNGCDKTFGTENVIFILGDSGVMFNNIPTSKEKRIYTKLANKPFITMIIDGNHDNHPRLYNLPEDTVFEGKVGVIKKNKVFHCRRGEIYTIQNKKIFTFGGATSIDRHLRIPGVSWWKEEVPSPAEMDHGLQMLEDNDNKVNFILTHTAPESITQEIIKSLGSSFFDPDPTRKYLEHICSIVSFDHFYCGHWHIEYDLNEYHFLYESIRQIA